MPTYAHYGPLWRTLCLACGWLLLVELCVPSLVAWLYQVDTAACWEPIARALARARTRQGLADTIVAWRQNAHWMAVALLGYQVLTVASWGPRCAERCVPRATPGMLGAIRAWVAGILLASTLWEHLPSSALLPREMIHGVGVLGLLYALPLGFDRFVASPTALAVFQGATALLLLAATLGYRTRLTVPLAAGAYLILAGILRQYAWFYHTGLIPLYLLCVLACTPCGDGFSIDRWLRVRRGAAVPDAHAATEHYGWSRYLVWAALAVPYVEAGLSKLRCGGLDWVHAANVKSILLIDTLNPMQFDWGITLRLVHAPDAFFWAIGVATILGELGFGLVLFSRRARLVLPLVTLSMHLGVWLLQNVLFFDLMLLQAIYYDWPYPRAFGTAGVGVSEATQCVDARPAHGGAWPRRLRVLTGLLLCCWVIRSEEYPFTAMQMYCQSSLSGVIYWYAVRATYESGTVVRAPIEAALPALRDARYRRLVRLGFGPPARATAELFLHAFVAAHNREAPPGARIVSVEVQRWLWDVARDPHDPEHGTLAERYGISVTP